MSADARPSLRRVLVRAIVGASVGAVILTALITVGLTRLGAAQRTIDDLRNEASRVADVASGLPCAAGDRPGAVARQLGARARFVPDGARRFAGLFPADEGRAMILGRDVYYASQPTTFCGRSGRLFVFTPATDVRALPAGFGPRLLFAAL